jgi:hypothetical protein
MKHPAILKQGGNGGGANEGHDIRQLQQRLQQTLEVLGLQAQHARGPVSFGAQRGQAHAQFGLKSCSREGRPPVCTQAACCCCLLLLLLLLLRVAADDVAAAACFFMHRAPEDVERNLKFEV